MRPVLTRVENTAKQSLRRYIDSKSKNWYEQRPPLWREKKELLAKIAAQH
jgi:hypothetical protein